MKVKMTCPFCGKDHCVEETESGYHCTSCEYDFTEEDINNNQGYGKEICVLHIRCGRRGFRDI